MCLSLSQQTLSFSSGRNIVYRSSFIGFFIFSWPVAFAPNISTCNSHSVSRNAATKFHILPVYQPLCSCSASSLVSAAPHSCPLLGVPSVTSSCLLKSGSEYISPRQLGYWMANDDPVVMKLTSPVDIFVSPMAAYSMAPFLGPVIGPLAAGFINQVSRISV